MRVKAHVFVAKHGRSCGRQAATLAEDGGGADARGCELATILAEFEPLPPKRWRFATALRLAKPAVRHRNHQTVDFVTDDVVTLIAMRLRLAIPILLLAATASAGVIDDLDDVSKWTAAPSDGVSLNLAEDRGAMRMDFDFRGHGGWAAARRNVNIDLPANYRFAFRVRGETPPNTLEIKFIDPSGENVWWVRRVAWEFPRDWTEVVADKRNIEFAWGPSPNHVLTKIGAIEVTVTAASGGKGSVWLDRITFDELPVDASAPLVTASSSIDGQTPDRAMDGRTDTAWRSAAGGAQWLNVDLRSVREFGGLVIAVECGRARLRRRDVDRRK